MKIKPTTPKDIIDFRKRVEITQHDLAQHLGVSDNTISRWERGCAGCTPPAYLRFALYYLEERKLINRAASIINPNLTQGRVVLSDSPEGKRIIREREHAHPPHP